MGGNLSLFRCLACWVVEFNCKPPRPLDRGVRLIKVLFKKIRELNLGTSSTVRLIEGVRLIQCPLNTGFTVLKYAK